MRRPGSGGGATCAATLIDHDRAQVSRQYRDPAPAIRPIRDPMRPTRYLPPARCIQAEGSPAGPPSSERKRTQDEMRKSFNRPSGARLVGLTGLMCLALNGCSSAGQSVGEAVQTPQATPALPTAAELHLPVETYLFSDADSVKLARAGAVLRRKCLQRFGLDQATPPAGQSTGPRTFMERRYGVTDLAEVTANGYHLGDRDPRTHPVVKPTFSAEQQKALTGQTGPGDTELRVNGVPVPPGGCYDEAKKELAGTEKLGSSEVAQQADFQTFKASLSAPQVKRAFDAWSSCMKGKGYSYPNPLDAISDRRFQGDSPTQPERDVATADVVCKQQVNLVHTWFAAETTLQNELIARQQADFTAALKAKTEQLAKAEVVLRDQ
ncbi:hypothetical protein [Kitasatospora sp. CMC57]|uniref:hypothetical protein n=1 Tax=Kitasatospora sp. CMC57 TaxID=3231513 RepID=UPI0038CD408A